MRTSKKAVVGGRRSSVSWWRSAFRSLTAGRRPLTTILFLLLAHAGAYAQAKRLVVLKVDGLQPDIVDCFVRERDPETGKSLLPWVEHVFYERGARLKNFYV